MESEFDQGRNFPHTHPISISCKNQHEPSVYQHENHKTITQNRLLLMRRKQAAVVARRCIHQVPCAPPGSSVPGPCARALPGPAFPCCSLRHGASCCYWCCRPAPGPAQRRPWVAGGGPARWHEAWLTRASTCLGGSPPLPLQHLQDQAKRNQERKTRTNEIQEKRDTN